MVKIPFTGTVKNAFGKPLSKLSVKLADGTLTTKHGIKKLDIKGEYDGYTEDEAGYKEIMAKGEGPDQLEVVKWRNARALATVKGQENEKAIAAAGFVKPSAENDPSVLLMTFYTAFLAVVKIEMPNASEEEQKAEARRKASEQSKVEWPSDDEE